MLFGLLQTHQFFQTPVRSQKPCLCDVSDEQQIRFYKTFSKMGKQAIVTDMIAPGEKGQVAYQGSWWTARSQQLRTFNPGQIVYVVARDNLTLYIESTAD
jgi:membrane protein implicated in regulation of membrane protease activity